MNKIYSPLIALTLCFGVMLPVASFAQMQQNHDHEQAAMSQTDAELTEGEIRKINLDTGKVTIKHGEIKNLDMPGMTMVFAVKDKDVLSKFKPKDKVRFRVVEENGKLIITEIQLAQ